MLGFESIQSKLLASHQSNKLHHAILLHGKKGIGKATFAKEFVSKILNSENPNHPDLLFIEKEATKKEISVVVIRKIAVFLNQTSAISKYKFIIIDAADELNKSSSNALLKTLEEPHANNFLILIAHNPNKVLATIKSRCHSIKVPDLRFEDFTAILRVDNQNISPEEITILSQICDNSPAKALTHGQDLINLYEIFLTSLHNRIIDSNLLKKISDKKFSFDIITEIVEFFLNRLVKFLSNTEIEFFFDEKEVFLNLRDKFSLQEIFIISDKIQNSLQKSKSLNLDRKLTFINIFNKIIINK